jgi:hypothetical protein
MACAFPCDQSVVRNGSNDDYDEWAVVKVSLDLSQIARLGRASALRTRHGEWTSPGMTLVDFLDQKGEKIVTTKINPKTELQDAETQVESQGSESE